MRAVRSYRSAERNGRSSGTIPPSILSLVFRKGVRGGKLGVPDLRARRGLFRGEHLSNRGDQSVDPLSQAPIGLARFLGEAARFLGEAARFLGEAARFLG